MLKAIQKHLVPLGIELPQSDRSISGGYFIWIHLPESLDAEEVTKQAREDENVIVAPGSLFEVPGDPMAHKFTHGIRLCFAWEDEEKLATGIERLAGVMRVILKSARDGVAPKARNGGATNGAEPAAYW